MNITLDVLDTFVQMVKMAVVYLLIAIGVEVVSLAALCYFVRAFILSLKRRKE